MIPRRFSLWQKLVALAPLLLLAVYLPGEMMMRCRMDGLLRPACCCPRAEQAQDCCDRVVSASEQRPVVEAARRADPASVAPTSLAIVVTSPVADSSPIRRFDGYAQRYGPPRGGPAIVLAKHAFLI